MTDLLFTPLTLGHVTLRNRIAISPMCEYSACEGLPGDWHLVHLGSRAVGGAGLVMTEGAAVSPEGRITACDAGLWNERQQIAWARITAFIKQQGAAAGAQLAHAGRKASVDVPWQGGRPQIGSSQAWTPLAPSAIPFDVGYAVPLALDATGIAQVISDFATAARRALDAGFDVLEIHAGHGYLIHQFLSPLSNQRQDRYGGPLENRARLLREVAIAVRGAWPAPRPLFVRVSATDWTPGGWDIQECVELARWLKKDGVDLIDCSSGGNIATAQIPYGPLYQVPFAARIRREAGIATAEVGMITQGAQARRILRDGAADLVLMGRELLRDPYFPRRAAQETGAPLNTPRQYLKAW